MMMMDHLQTAYESVDLETRLYCLELLTQFHWSCPEFYPPQLIFAGMFSSPLPKRFSLLMGCLEADELLNDDEESQTVAALMQYPRDETEVCYIFNFNPTPNPEDDICRLIRPQKFYDPMALSLARIDIGRYRSLGYCPLHRHPDMVEFIEALSSLYGSALTKCLGDVDFEAAKLAAKSPKWPKSTKSNCTMLDYRFQTLIVEPAMAINNGIWRASRPGVIDQKFRYVECKGNFPPPSPLRPLSCSFGKDF